MVHDTEAACVPEPRSRWQAIQDHLAEPACFVPPDEPGQPNKEEVSRGMVYLGLVMQLAILGFVIYHTVAGRS